MVVMMDEWTQMVSSWRVAQSRQHSAAHADTRTGHDQTSRTGEVFPQLGM